MTNIASLVLITGLAGITVGFIQIVIDTIKDKKMRKTEADIQEIIKISEDFSDISVEDKSNIIRTIFNNPKLISNNTPPASVAADFGKFIVFVFAEVRNRLMAHGRR
jgi:hypothetical protein